MTRLVVFLLTILGLSFGFSWLADNPGTITVDWQGYHAEPTVFQVVVLTAVLTALGICVWTILRQIWTSPAAVSHFLTKRRQQRGLDALSSGMIAIGAGDRATATRYALQARKSLPNEPLTHLLRAQAAQLSGDRATSRRIFEAMLSAPDTEQLGLRGLYLEAAREGEGEAQRQFAQRAIALNPKLSWPVEGLFELQCKDGDWAGALETLNLARRHGTLEKTAVDRRRAVLLTGQAMALEDHQSDKALGLAQEAHALARDLVPAAVIAGRLLAAKGNTAKAAKVLQRTWARSPHPDLALAYAYARIGDSPRDRFDRVKQLAALNPHSSESALAVAAAAIEAQDFEQARDALSPLLEGRLTRRVATLMARIEKEQHGDQGRVREWLARAVHAQRDPAWTADGVVAENWAPASPVTGALDAFEWRVPVEEFDSASSVTGSSSALEQLMALESTMDGSRVGAEPIEAGQDTSDAGVAARPLTRAPDTAPATAPPAAPVAEAVNAAMKVPTAESMTEPTAESTAESLPGAKSVAVRGGKKTATPQSQPPSGSVTPVAARGAAGSGIARADAEIIMIEAEPAGPEPMRAQSNPVAPVPPARPAKNYRSASGGGGLASSATTATVVIKQASDVKPDRAARSAAATSTLSQHRAEAAVLVPLHAPDDPGPDGDRDEMPENGRDRAWPYRVT